MSAPSLPLPDRLTNQCSLKWKNVSTTIQFGRKFKQVVEEGTGKDTRIQVWSLVYSPLTGADLLTVRNFLNQVTTKSFFYWIPFGESTQRKFKITKDSVSEKLFNTTLIQISFEIEEDFTLGT